MKYYIINEIGYQYNDETYDKQDGGTPVKIFNTKLDAEKYADELTYRKIIDLDINCYGYGDKITDKETVAKILTEITDCNYSNNIDMLDDWDFQLPKMTFTDFQKIKPYLDIELFVVVPCDGDLNSEKKTSKTSILKEIELENTENNHNKIWRGILYSNLDVVTEWGQIGATLQNKLFENAGEEFLEKKIAEKLKKGYIKT